MVKLRPKSKYTFGRKPNKRLGNLCKKKKKTWQQPTIAIAKINSTWLGLGKNQASLKRGRMLMNDGFDYKNELKIIYYKPNK